MLPVAIFLSDERVFQARFVLAIAYGASIGGIMTPIGTPPNLILMGFLESQGLPSIAFVNWMFLTMPLAIVMLAIMPWVLCLGLPKEHEAFAIHDEKPVMTAEQRKLAWVLVLLGSLLLFNSKIEPWYGGLGLNDKLIMLGFGLLMFVPGMSFLNWEDTRRIPYEIIFLFGAGFSIAGALVDTGLAEVIARSLQAFAQFHTFFLILVIAALITFSTEITSNTALVSLAVPIIYSLGQYRVDPDGGNHLWQLCLHVADRHTTQCHCHEQRCAQGQRDDETRAGIQFTGYYVSDFDSLVFLAFVLVGATCFMHRCH